MNAERKKLITQWVVGLACVICALSFAFGTRAFATGAVAGGIVAIVNWMTIRWAIGRVEASASGATWGVVLGLKFFGAIAASAIALMVLHASPLGFMLGLTPFVLGLTFGTLRAPTPIAEQR